jgi:hypothetical protein
MQFDHLGMVTQERKEGEMFIAPTRVWVTDFQKHPYHVEWLRFEPDSPVSGPVREMPHVAYRVDDLEAAAQGLKVLLPPFDVGFAVVGFYQTADGAVVEFMKYKEDKTPPPDPRRATDTRTEAATGSTEKKEPPPP